jgi:hypothetical protein
MDPALEPLTVAHWRANGKRFPESFLLKVQFSDRCWLWTGHVTKNGYGRFHGTPRHVLAHRFFYEWAVGPVPEGLQLDHLCRVRTCVRPSHLEPVTAQTNFRRGKSPAAIIVRTNRCKYGHELTPDNLALPELRFGRRRCRTCYEAYQLDYALRRRKKVTHATR